MVEKRENGKVFLSSISGRYFFWINELGDDIKKILIIGHNPTLHTLTEMLTNEHINRFTTCNLAKISFEGKWKTLAPSKCSLISIIKPKEMIN